MLSKLSFNTFVRFHFISFSQAKIKLSLICSIVFFLPIIVFAQPLPQGEQFAIKEAILDSNNVTTVFFNYGSICKPNYLGNVADMVWNGLGYMFEFGPIVAAKVINDNGDTLRITDDSFVLPSQGTYSPDGSVKWGWLPDSGYANPNQNEIATKNNPASWPGSWATWPYGDSVNTSLNEAYYVMDDFSNAKFPYYPFPGDTTKRGLGLKAEVRVYEFGGSLKDALLIKYKITNVSQKNLSEVYFGFQGDPHIGGYNDYSDNRVHLIGPNGPAGDVNNYFAKNTIYLWDNDGLGMDGKHPGYMSFKFLNTPDNKDLTSFHTAPYTNSLPNVPKNSALMWNWLSGGIDTSSTLYTQPGDNIINFGTGSFSLAAGETKEIEVVIFFSNDFQDMKNDAVTMYFDHNWPGIGNQIGGSGGNNNYKIELTSQNSGAFSGDVPVTWKYSGTDVNAKLLIEYSSDRGSSWYPAAWDIPIDSSYTWNTVNYKDGVNYLLRLVAYNPLRMSQYYYNISSAKFTVNNPGDAQPELELNIPFVNSVIAQKTISIPWLAEDADNNQLSIDLEYSTNQSGPFTEISKSNYSTGINSFAWDVSSVPNANNYYLKVTASDGVLDSSLVAGPFSINYSENSYVTNNFVHLTGNSTPTFYLQEIDTSQITTDTYELTFTASNPAQKTMAIKDVNNGKAVLSNYLLQQEISTPEFDGIKLTVNDTPTGINYDKSKFDRSDLDSTVKITFPPIAGNPRVAVPQDWIIVFNNMDTNQNSNYISPGDTASTNINNVKVIAPFRIYNITAEKYPAQYIAFIKAGIQNLSRWIPSQSIILQPQEASGPTTSYQIDFNFNAFNLPHAGDTLHIITYKEITTNDVFRFAVRNNTVITHVNELNETDSYSLEQNYPNPFNPSTTIEYQIPQSGLVTLKIYNMLGQEVKTLLYAQQSKGKYTVVFDASSLASGVYIYQLNVNGYLYSRKMILLK